MQRTVGGTTEGWMWFTTIECFRGVPPLRVSAAKCHDRAACGALLNFACRLEKSIRPTRLGLTNAQHEKPTQLKIEGGL